MKRTSAGVRFPPPLLFVAGFLLAQPLHRWIPLGMREGNARWVAGWLLVASGAALAGWGITTFAAAHTAIIPHHPASRLVTHGPYALSRNPMYGGLTVAYAGGALLTATLWPLVLLPLILWTLYRTVVRREEAYLADAFGDEYADYCVRVRRWL